MATTRPSWKDAYDVQMGLWRWLRTENGLRFLRGGFQIETQNLERGTQEMLAQLYGSEEKRLFDADPIFVSAEMCQLIEAASETFAPEPLYLSDLITPYGFVYYDRPFSVPDRFDRPTTIHGISWSPMLVSRDEADRTALLSLLRGKEDRIDKDALNDLLQKEGERLTGIGLTIYADSNDTEWPDGMTHPPLYPMHMTPWWFGMSFEGNEEDENGVPTGAEWWWKIVQTTFRLLQQRISVKHHERPERHQRREGLRAGFDEREVLVVRLRREASEQKEPSGEPGNWTHRWIVHGFWRNQWYPSSQTHRQIYVGDFVKGPEHLPLVIKPRRAFVLNR